MELFFILFIVQSVNGNIKFVNHSMAQIECEAYGGLAPYTDFDKYDRTLKISGEETSAMTLTEGESAWIQGYAVFSTILSWFGCFEITKQDPLNLITISENTEYSCSKHCVTNTNNTKYIALRGNACFCLTYDDLKQYQRHACDYTHCQQWINRVDNIFEGAINVYELHNHTTMPWKQGSARLRQCVYGQIKVNGDQRRIFYETDSCFTPSKRGFICVHSYKLQLNETCEKYHNVKNDTPEVCFTSENLSWVEAKNQCCEYKGKLIDEVSVSIRMYAEINGTYWVGMFRPFTVQNGSTSSCLSATRIKNTLLLDPDNCSNEKRFLCRDDITQIKVTTPTFTTTAVKTELTNKTTITTSSFNSEQTEQTTVATSPFTTSSFSTVSTNQTANETTVVSKHKETNSAKSKYTYIGIGVSVVFVVMLTIIIIVYKKRKHNMKTKADAKTFENNVVCIEPDNDIDSKDRYVSSVKDKLENKTKDMCMQDHCYDTAEQYSVVNSKKSKEETDYDRLHVVLQNKGKKTENVDGNIYDYTKDLSDEDQYHVLGNVDHKKFNNKTEDTYGQLQTKDSTYDTMAQGKALTSSFDTYAHLS